MHDDLHDIWPRVQAHLRDAVDASTYDIWLDGLTPVELNGRTLVVACAPATRGWVTDRFGRVLQACAAAVLGADVTVSVVAAGTAAERSVSRGISPSGSTSLDLNPKYTFDQFVIGEGNRLAHAAALAVAEQPGQAYNPLFLYGPPGLGKTHMLHSIARYVTDHAPGLVVRCVTVEAFTNDFVDAVTRGTMDAFKAVYRHVDVLLLDDVQFLERKARTEEEFFHTFNALYDAGSQLVLTSDRLPRDMEALEDRLRERFESGLVADLDAPDRATRLTILRMRARLDGLTCVPEDALELIADRVTDNVRALEGALIRIVAFHSLSRRPLDAALAAEVLDSLYPMSTPARRSIAEVQLATSRAFGVSVEDLVSPSRVGAIAYPRQIAMFLARELTPASLPAIGRAFGGRNHSTVLHACRRAAVRLADDDHAAAIVADITAQLAQPTADRS